VKPYFHTFLGILIIAGIITGIYLGVTDETVTEKFQRESEQECELECEGEPSGCTSDCVALKYKQLREQGLRDGWADRDLIPDMGDQFPGMDR